MPTIPGPNRICKEFRGFKRALKVRTCDSSGVVTVGKGGWDGEPKEEGGWRRQSSRQRWSEDLPSAPATPASCSALSNSPAGCSADAPGRTGSPRSFSPPVAGSWPPTRNQIRMWVSRNHFIPCISGSLPVVHRSQAIPRRSPEEPSPVRLWRGSVLCAPAPAPPLL